MDNSKELKDAIEKYSNMPIEKLADYKTETNIPKRKSAMELMYEWLTIGGGFVHCEQIVIDKAEELVEKEKDLNEVIEDLKEKLRNAEHYAAKKELELLRLSQMPDEGGQEKRGQKINTNGSDAEQSDAAAIAPMQCYAGEAEPLPAKAYCSECGMAVNSSREQHYHWCSLAGNGA